MLYSKTCEYAIRSLACLAAEGKGAVKGAAEISERTGVPGPYVSKIFQSLVKAGILISRRGAGGGVAFRKDPKVLTLMNIVEAIDDLESFTECAMGLDRCEDGNGCPVHEIWKKTKEEIILKLKKTKLVELSENPKKLKYRELNRARLRASS